jgi:hypothetical protein
MGSSEHGPDETSPAPGPGSSPPRPTWVKVMGIVLALVVVAIVVTALAGGGEHGPGRHQPGGAPAGHTPPMQHDS